MFALSCHGLFLPILFFSINVCDGERSQNIPVHRFCSFERVRRRTVSTNTVLPVQLLFLLQTISLKAANLMKQMIVRPIY